MATEKKSVTLESINDTLTAHITSEEETFERGEKRMDDIERDLQPLQKMYYAIIGSGTVASILIGVLVFIYMSDRSEMKTMSQAIHTQGMAIERLLVTTNNIITLQEKDLARLDRHIENNK